MTFTKVKMDLYVHVHTCGLVISKIYCCKNQLKFFYEKHVILPNMYLNRKYCVYIPTNMVLAESLLATICIINFYLRTFGEETHAIGPYFLNNISKLC